MSKVLFCTPSRPIFFCGDIHVNYLQIAYGMGLQSFYGKRSQRLLRAVSRAAHGQIKINGISNSLNYCGIFNIIYVNDTCDRGPLNTNWRAADWKPMVCGEIRLNSA